MVVVTVVNESASSRARNASVDDLLKRSLEVAKKVQREAGDRHPHERIVWATALLVRSGVPYPRTRDVVALCLTVQRAIAGADIPATFSDEERAAGRAEWDAIRSELAKKWSPSHYEMWVEPLAALGKTTDALWLVGPRQVTSWFDRRYRKQIEDSWGIPLRLIPREESRDVSG